jgi:hypothetical protein
VPLDVPLGDEPRANGPARDVPAIGGADDARAPEPAENPAGGGRRER